LEQASYLRAGQAKWPSSENNSVSLKSLSNLYLEHQESRVASGDKRRHINDQILILRDFAKFIGMNRAVSDTKTIDLQNFRTKLIKAGKTVHTINNILSTAKAMYHWAFDNEIITIMPNLKAVKKLPMPKREVLIFKITDNGM